MKYQLPTLHPSPAAWARYGSNAQHYCYYKDGISVDRITMLSAPGA